MSSVAEQWDSDADCIANEIPGVSDNALEFFCERVASMHFDGKLPIKDARIMAKNRTIEKIKAGTLGD